MNNYEKINIGIAKRFGNQILDLMNDGHLILCVMKENGRISCVESFGYESSKNDDIYFGNYKPSEYCTITESGDSFVDTHFSSCDFITVFSFKEMMIRYARMIQKQEGDMIYEIYRTKSNGWNGDDAYGLGSRFCNEWANEYGYALEEEENKQDDAKDDNQADKHREKLNEEYKDKTNWKFSRKSLDSYNVKERVLKEAKFFIDEGVLLIPKSDGIIGYWDGKLLVKIGLQKLESFSGKTYKINLEQYNKDDAKDFWAIFKNDPLQAYEKYIRNIKIAIERGLPNDKERTSQQIIAENHKVDGVSNYVVCDFEAAVSKLYFNNDKIKPEIDLIAIHPKNRKIILIEYKCQKGTLLYGPQNIERHCEDYKKILHNTCTVDIRREIMKSYNLLQEINEQYNKRVDENDAKNFKLQVLFLITNRPYKKEKAETNITDRAYKIAVEKIYKAIIESEFSDCFYIMRRETVKDVELEDENFTRVIDEYRNLCGGDECQ